MMVSTDPIADMLTRIRNAVAVRKHTVVMPHSKIKESVAQVLAQNNFVNSVSVDTKEHTLTIVINTEEENARISTIDRMSTPGRRMYAKSTEIPKVRQGRGIVVVSTSKGVMSGEAARAQQLGGELICKVS